MAQTFQTPPSMLAGIRDPYAAYCFDEAMADYIARLRDKQRLRPPKTKDNRDLIAALGGD